MHPSEDGLPPELYTMRMTTIHFKSNDLCRFEFTSRYIQVQDKIVSNII
jgi:hypothetical protein